MQTSTLEPLLIDSTFTLRGLGDSGRSILASQAFTSSGIHTTCRSELSPKSGDRSGDNPLSPDVSGASISLLKKGAGV